MSDVKSKSAPREPGRSKVSPGIATPVEAAPSAPAAIVPTASVPEAPTVAAIASGVPQPVADIGPDAVSPTVERRADSAGDPWAGVAEAQGALVRGFEEVAVQLSGMTRSGIAAASDAAIALAGARTFSEAVEINAGLARRAVDAMIEGSTKLSAIGVKTASDASRPILSQFGG